MPPPLLKDVNVSNLDFDEFVRLLAMARYMQELEGAIIQNGVARAFGEEKK